MTDAQKKSNRVRSQSYGASKLRFTHNEIERKRRARLKSETDFLHRQLPRAIYRDKLAIFKAGAEMLAHYAASDSSESRNLILTDKAYSECIISNFTGFGMRIRCHDGVIMTVTDNLQQYLGPLYPSCIGKSLFSLIVPNSLTESILRQNLFLSADEKDKLSTGLLIPRNFILPLKTSPNAEQPFCFVEFCGDIVVTSTIATTSDKTSSYDIGNERDCANSKEDFVLQVLCRLLDHVPFSTPDKAFSMRLKPTTHTILELIGRCLPTGVSASNLVGRPFLDIVSPAFRSLAEANLQNAELSGESTFTVDGLQLSSSATNPAFAISSTYEVVVKCVRANDHLHCLVADFFSKTHQQLESL